MIVRAVKMLCCGGKRKRNERIDETRQRELALNT